MRSRKKPLDALWKLEPSTTTEAESRRYLARVWLHMAAAIMISAAAAFYVGYSPTMRIFLFNAHGLTAGGWIITLAPLLLVIFLGGNVARLSAGAASAGLTLFAVLLGLSLGGVFLSYTAAGIGCAFLAASLGFLVLAALGARTSLQLTRMRRFLSVALVGLLFALALNLIAGSSAFATVLAVAAILVFAGLATVDVRRLVQASARTPDNPAVAALALYLDLVNIWLSMLRLSGRRR